MSRLLDKCELLPASSYTLKRDSLRPKIWIPFNRLSSHDQLLTLDASSLLSLLTLERNMVDEESESLFPVDILTDLFARCTLSDYFKKNYVRPTQIIAMLTLGCSDPCVKKVRKVAAERILKNERFHSIFVKRNRKIYIKTIPKESVDLNYHIVELDGKGVYDKDDLNEFISDTTNQYWDPTKPLWKLTLITNMKDGKSMLFCCIDHAIGDGIAMLSVLRSLIDDPPEDVASFQRRRTTPPSFRWSHHLTSFIYGIYEGLIGWVIKPEDPHNCLKIPPNHDLSDATGKVFRKTPAIPLKTMKAMKNKLLGVTMNDIVIATVSMGIRYYFEKMNDPILKKLDRGTQLQAMSMVNVRPKASNTESVVDLGNRFLTINYYLPIPETNKHNPIEVVYKAKSVIDEFKISPALYFMDKSASTISGYLPEFAIVKAALGTARKPTCLLTNVMGPPKQSKIAGYVLDDLTFFTSSGIGLLVCVISYNDFIRFNFTMDKSANINDELLSECFVKAFDDLKVSILGSGCDDVSAKTSNNEDIIRPPYDMTPLSARVLEYVLSPIVLIGVVATSLVNRFLQ